MNRPRSRHYLTTVWNTTRNQILLASFDRDALSINPQRIATLNHQHVFIEFMDVLGGSCGLSARPKDHLALLGSVEDISFDTGRCLTRPGDPVRGVPHELRKGIHAGVWYRKRQPQPSRSRLRSLDYPGSRFSAGTRRWSIFFFAARCGAGVGVVQSHVHLGMAHNKQNDRWVLLTVHQEGSLAKWDRTVIPLGEETTRK